MRIGHSDSGIGTPVAMRSLPPTWETHISLWLGGSCSVTFNSERSCSSKGEQIEEVFGGVNRDGVFEAIGEGD